MTICEICGKEYEDKYAKEKGPYAPDWCEKCTKNIHPDGWEWLRSAFLKPKRGEGPDGD